MKFALAILAVAFLVAPSYGKVFTRCSLAKELYSLGVPKSELSIWTCIAQHESSYNTAAVGPPNSNGSNDWGIFQINDYYWCAPPSGRFSYNQCKLGCRGLTTDDVKPDLTCAQLVKKQQGWKAWSTWKYCSGTLPSINDCF